MDPASLRAKTIWQSLLNSGKPSTSTLDNRSKAQFKALINGSYMEASSVAVILRPDQTTRERIVVVATYTRLRLVLRGVSGLFANSWTFSKAAISFLSLGSTWAALPPELQNENRKWSSISGFAVLGTGYFVLNRPYDVTETRGMGWAACGLLWGGISLRHTFPPLVCPLGRIAVHYLLGWWDVWWGCGPGDGQPRWGVFVFTPAQGDRRADSMMPWSVDLWTSEDAGYLSIAAAQKI